MDNDTDRLIIYFLDDTQEGRRDLQMQLRSLFAKDFEVIALPLEKVPEEYIGHLNDRPVAGIFIDQNLDETGEITGYTGVKLAGVLRVVFPELPIFLVTGHPIQGELESEDAGDADSVVAKGDLITDSQTSLKFRRQFLRRVQQYEKALSGKQTRFRHLLAKKLGDGLVGDEQKEYEDLRFSREVATDEAESISTKSVITQLDKISALLSKIEDVRHTTLD